MYDKSGQWKNDKFESTENHNKNLTFYKNLRFVDWLIYLKLENKLNKPKHHRKRLKNLDPNKTTNKL